MTPTIDEARAALLSSIAYYQDPPHYEPGDRAYWHDDAEKMLDALIAAVRAEAADEQDGAYTAGWHVGQRESAETLAALARSMDEWLRSSNFPSPDDRQAITAWLASIRAALAATPAEEVTPREIGYTAFECERDMRRMTGGERGCSNPEEHRL